MTRRFREGAPESPDGFPVHPERAVLVGLDQAVRDTAAELEVGMGKIGRVASALASFGSPPPHTGATAANRSGWSAASRHEP